MIRTTTSAIISKKLITTTTKPKVSSDVEKFDTVIIGAGVIGLAVAHAIVQSITSSSSLSKSLLSSQQQSPHEILIIDRGYTIGTETSSRNSEVIHGGLYYPKTSLKGQLCVYGKQLIYSYCQEKKVPIRQCGKLIVANTIEQYNHLQHIQKQAILNGVNDTNLISSQQQVNDEFEPNIQAQYGALYSPSTGIIDSHAFMEQLLYDILNPTIQNEQQNEHNNNNNIVNTTLALRTKVIDGFVSTTTNSSTNDNDPYHIYVCTQDTTTDSNDTTSSTMWLKCRQLINCSGLWSTFIANMFHNTKNQNNKYSNHWQPPQQYFCRGTYYKLQCNKENHPNFQHLIYPLPTNDYSGLGIHATIDILGENIKFGPNVDWVPIHIINPDEIDLIPDSNCMDQFYNSIATYYPAILNNNNMTLLPDYVGIRPKLLHPSLFNKDQHFTNILPFQDFQIIGPNIHHIPGLIHLFGIESPGLTSSMAIGQYIVQMLTESKK